MPGKQEHNQLYPISHPQQNEPSQPLTKSLATQQRVAQREFKEINEPIKGKWIISAVKDDYPFLNENNFQSLTGAIITRTDSEIHIETEDFKDEKKIKAIYATLVNAGISKNKILGYQREIEANREKKSNKKNPHTYMYNSNCELTPYGMIVKRIHDLSLSWNDHEFTKDKQRTLRNFQNYYSEKSKDVPVSELSNINIITEWVQDFKNANKKKSPFDLMGLGRGGVSVCGISFFVYAKNTRSLELFEKMVAPGDRDQLKKLMDADLGEKSSCFDGIKKSLESVARRISPF